MTIQLKKRRIPEFDQVVEEEHLAISKMHYRNGKLYLCNGRRFAVLSAGKDPHCWVRKASEDEWHNSEYFADRLFMKYDFLNNEPYHASYVRELKNGWVEVHGQRVPHYTEEELSTQSCYFKQIPLEITSRIEVLNARRWQMYVFMSRNEEGIALFDGNPALAFLKANVRVFEHAGFSEEEKYRETLRKVDVWALNVSNLLRLRQALTDQEICKWFADLPCITNEIILLTGNQLWRNMLTFDLLRQLADDDIPMDFREIFPWIFDTAHWSSESPLVLGRISSVEQLVNRWSEIEQCLFASSNAQDDGVVELPF